VSDAEDAVENEEASATSASNAEATVDNEEDSAAPAPEAEEENTLVAEDASGNEGLSATSTLDSDQEESVVDNKDLDNDESSAEPVLVSEEVDVDETSNDESMLASDEFEVDETSNIESLASEEAEVGETSTDESEPSTSSQTQPPQELLHLRIDVRNVVNGTITTRPENLRPHDEWRIEYSITEQENSSQTRAQYNQLKARRRQTLTREVEDADVADGETSKPTTKQKATSFYVRLLRNLARQGREYRAKLDTQDKGKEKVVYQTFGPGVVEKVDSVDSYMAWLYKTKAAPEQTSEASGSPEEVKNVDN
jgi:hypothetical protein